MRADPDAQALHLRHPMATIWDDHDLSDNAWRTGAKHHDPEQHGPWDGRVRGRRAGPPGVAAGPLRDPADPLVTWRSLAVGDLAELLLLDTRFAGRDRQAGDDEAPPSTTPTARCSATRSGRWLARAARRRRPARGRSWRSGVVVNELELPWPRPLAPGERTCCRTATRCSTAGSCTTTSGTATRPSGAG